MTDTQLLKLCRKYGARALRWRRKFVGLLPEVNKRRLYEKKRCSSIFEFAAKLSGVSRKQVCIALNLEERFKDKPPLYTLLVEGGVSVNKLARVVSIATPENAEFLANQVQLLSQPALETLVRDCREIERLDGLQKPQNEVKSLRPQTVSSLDDSTATQGLNEKISELLKLDLNDEVLNELLELKGRGISINTVLKDALTRRRAAIQEEKARIVEELPPTSSRSLPQKVRRVLTQEFGTKCSIHTCNKPAQTIHHTQRWALGHNHDPNFLSQLCTAHHQIAHAIDQKVQGKRLAYRSSA